MLWTIAYASLADVTRRSVEIMDIARVSMRNNVRLGITGALYFDDYQFFQVLEGDRRTVGAMYGRIRADPRHHAVTTLHEGPIKAARFPDWAMKFVDGGWVPGGCERFDHAALCAADARAVAALAEELTAY